MLDVDRLYLSLAQLLDRGALQEVEEKLDSLQEQATTEKFVVLRAALEEKKGNSPGALALLESFLSQNFMAPVARSNLARLQWQQGESERALGTLKMALAQNPNQERSLHFLAALEQERMGFPLAFSSLLGYGRQPEAWLPAWVAATLASQHGKPEQVVQALLLAAQKAQGAFPPDQESLWDLLANLGEHAPSTWSRIRSYCPPELMEVGDGLYTLAPSVSSPPEDLSPVWLSVPGGLSLKFLGPPLLSLSPVIFIKAEEWLDQSLAPRLGRGMSLLLCEALHYGFQVPAEVSVPYYPAKGLLSEQQILSPQTLAERASPSVETLGSLYLSRNARGEFLLDLELYNERGVYQSRSSSRSESLHQAFVELLPALARPRQVGEPSVFFGFDEAMARDTALSFHLCHRGQLKKQTIPNPEISLEIFAEHAVKSQSVFELACYWRALQEAEGAGFPTAGPQIEQLRPILERDPWFRARLP